LMRAELGLPSVRGDDEKGGGMMGGFGGSMGGVGGGKAKRPINVKFEIPYFTTSGIQVRYLKIIEPKVSPCFLSRKVDTDTSVAAISFAALGTIHHSIWRYRCTITGRGLNNYARLIIDALNQTLKTRQYFEYLPLSSLVQTRSSKQQTTYIVVSRVLATHTLQLSCRLPHALVNSCVARFAILEVSALVQRRSPMTES
jgi:hypothetical protein